MQGFRVYRVIQGIYWGYIGDNGKENGNYYLEFEGLGFRGLGSIGLGV